MLCRRSPFLERLAVVEDRGNAYSGAHLGPLHAPESARGPATSSVRACNMQDAVPRCPQPLLVSLHDVACRVVITVLQSD